jgi:hypothetical protein
MRRKALEISIEAFEWIQEKDEETAKNIVSVIFCCK